METMSLEEIEQVSGGEGFWQAVVDFIFPPREGPVRTTTIGIRG